MKIKRIYNNNVVMVENQNGEEMIVIGRGLAFGKKVGEFPDEKQIEKIFTLAEHGIGNKLAKLIQEIPAIYLTITEEIVAMIRKDSDLNPNDSIYITLTDHISMSLEREKTHLVFQNPLLMEIKQFYKKEFALSREAAKIIYKHMGIHISEDEMGFITLHIVNATLNQQADKLVLSLQMISRILKIVQEHYEVEFDQESLLYERFLRHLQFFARRVLDRDGKQLDDVSVLHLTPQKYPKAFACVAKIDDYVWKTYHKNITDSEKEYLIYHILTLISNEEERKNERKN